VKIYTKTGDDGETGLFGGARVPKDHARVMAYGQIDETNAAIGFALAVDPPTFCRALLETVQRDLLTIGAELATPRAERVEQALRGRPAIGPVQIRVLEAAIDERETGLAPLKQFILPGGTPKAAALHLARTVCRRAERAVVAMIHADEPAPPSVPIYLNRLSDLLFVLARAANSAAGVSDAQW